MLHPVVISINLEWEIIKIWNGTVKISHRCEILKNLMQCEVGGFFTRNIDDNAKVLIANAVRLDLEPQVNYGVVSVRNNNGSADCVFISN